MWLTDLDTDYLLIAGVMPSWHIVTTLFHLFSQLLHMAFMNSVPGSQQQSPLRPWYDWRQEITEKKHKSMDNEHQSITGGKGVGVWQQGELSWSLACAWLILCLTARGDRDSHNALQTTVWRLNFLQPQSPKPSPSSGSLLWWCLLADRGSYVTINSVALVINHRPWLSWTSLFHLK